jgi:hypothetical protein
MSDVLRLRDEKLEWREIDGEVVALDGQQSEYLGVNRAGASLWPLLASGATREALIDSLSERFGIDRDRAARDVDSFVGALAERGLLAR